MKRLHTLVFCFLSFFAVNASCQELKWFHSIGWYPFTMKDEATNKIYGVSNDIMVELAKKLNTTASFQNVPWKRGFMMLDDGTMDICAGAYDNAERRGMYLFSTPLFKNETRIFVNKDKLFKFSELADLKGKRLGKPLGSSYGAEFDSFAKANIQMSENPGGADKLVVMLTADRLDGFLGDYVDTMYRLRKANLADKVIALDKPVSSVDVYFMVSKASPWGGKMEQINQGIKELVASGKIAEIVKRY
jgi:polar amino acid transport system substrate-binding protein